MPTVRDAGRQLHQLLHHHDSFMTTLPLKGIKVLDLSRVLAGPLCTMMLGDLGADVIKVERPGTGDETRGWGPPFDARGESAYFLSCNRNKRSLEADLGKPADRDLLCTLARDADVVVENFLPGALSQKGLDAVELLQANPSLIWCTIGGYSHDPRRPGYDVAVQAESGWMSVTGDPGGPPMKTAVAFVDVITGKDAAVAILAALVGRERRTAAERRLRITLAGSAAAALVNVAQNVLVSGGEARRWGNAHANLVPYQLFETADRPIVIAVGSDPQWLALTEVLGDATLATDEILRSNAGRVQHRGRCVDAIQTVLRSAPAAEWKRRLEAAGVPMGEVRSILDAVRDAAGSALTGMPSSVGGTVRLPPPRLGEHTEEIHARRWG
jgi:crotonobetainyl-CoA:carnitine CoA-transferase CaiB-like acyl-CoA transferase